MMKGLLSQLFSINQQKDFELFADKKTIDLKICQNKAELFDFESYRSYQKQKPQPLKSLSKFQFNPNTNQNITTIFGNKTSCQISISKQKKRQQQAKAYKSYHLNIKQGKTHQIIANKGKQNQKQSINELIYVQLKKDLLYFSSKNQLVKTYLVVQGFKYPLSLGNQLKIGRKTYQVIQIMTKPQSNQKTYQGNNKLLSNLNHLLPLISKNKITIQQDQQKTCKYCLMTQKQFNSEGKQYIQNDGQDDSKYDNLMISPCKCKGSCSSVHIGCLKHWLNEKIVIKSNRYMQVLSFRNLHCQICLSILPLRLNLPTCTKQLNLISHLFSSQSHFYPYLILKSTNSSQQQVIKIKFQNINKLKIGRLGECQVRLDDVAVSKIHCVISIDNDKIWVKDNGSTYGTLLRIQQEVRLGNYHNVQSLKFLVNGHLVQINKSHNQFKLFNK